MEQKELPFDLDALETSPQKKRHIFMAVMSDIGHLKILSTERKNSTAWGRLSKHRTQNPSVFDHAVHVLESF